MRYPIGIQEFEKIRNGGYVYVDKTALIYRMISEGEYYFLSRPRRFGKSLLVSTMEAYFQGRKELFSGLAIEKLAEDWTESPVFRLDMSGKTYQTVDDLSDTLDKNLKKWEEKYGVEKGYSQPDLRFQDIIETVAEKTGRQAVVLIDEYDKPMLDALGNQELGESVRRILQGFYSVIKKEGRYIRFGFLTGVTKLGRLSVFSGLNNLNDISLDSRYADICGVSEDDLHEYFGDSVKELAAENGLSAEECYARLKKWYDGYHFSEDSPGIYNPFSLLNTLQKKKFHEYWFETGTPTFLVEIMKRTSFDVSTLEHQDVDSTLMSTVDAIYENPVPLLFQTGYLTISGYNADYFIYHLTFPNLEVKRGFLNYLLKYYTTLNDVSGSNVVFSLSSALQQGRPEDFMSVLSSLFAGTPYQIQGNAEKDFQYAIYIIMELLGIYIDAERQTSNGRIDLLIRTDRFIYVIELKVDSSAEEALRQIEEKGYAKPFASDSRRLYRIGVNFSTSTRRIEEWKIE